MSKQIHERTTKRRTGEQRGKRERTRVRGYLGISFEQACAEGREGLTALGAVVGRGVDGRACDGA